VKRILKLFASTTQRREWMEQKYREDDELIVRHGSMTVEDPSHETITYCRIVHSDLDVQVLQGHEWNEIDMSMQGCQRYINKERRDRLYAQIRD